jgi:hypothetical protein
MEREHKYIPLLPILPIVLSGCKEIPNASQDLGAAGLILGIGTIVYLGYRSQVKVEKDDYNRRLKEEIKKQTKNHTERHFLYKDNKKK